MRYALFAGAALAALIAGAPAEARRERSRRLPVPRTVEAPRPAFPGPSSLGPRPSTDGIIHWNTPNKDGNFGGPGAGGSSGS